MFRPNQIIAIIGLTVLALAPPTLGRQAAAPPKPDSGGLLSGPTVEDDAQKQTERTRRKEGARDRRTAELPLRQWLAALREVELNQEQQASVRQIMSEFTDAQREFMESLSEEDRAMLDRGRRSIEEDREPSRDMREAMQKIESQMPRPETYQRRIWAVLNEEQQARMKEEIDAARLQWMERRERRRGDEPGMDGTLRRPQGPPPEQMAPSMTEESNGPGPADPRRRSRAERRAGGPPLDEPAQRRIRFLTSRVSAASTDRLPHFDGEPTERERQFNFDDDRTPVPKADRHD